MGEKKSRLKKKEKQKGSGERIRMKIQKRNRLPLVQSRRAVKLCLCLQKMFRKDLAQLFMYLVCIYP